MSKKVKKIAKVALPVAAVAAPFLAPALIPAGAGALGTGLKLASGAAGLSSALGGGQKQQSPQAQKIIINSQPYEQGSPQAIEAAQAETFIPQRPEALARPEALNELSGFSQAQERSALATQGLNTGLGSEEDQYYRNLLQRSLIGEGNNVSAQQNDFLMPIESQYFSQRGYNTSNIMDFLKAIRG